MGSAASAARSKLARFRQKTVYIDSLAMAPVELRCLPCELYARSPACVETCHTAGLRGQPNLGTGRQASHVHAQFGNQKHQVGKHAELPRHSLLCPIERCALVNEFERTSLIRTQWSVRVCCVYARGVRLAHCAVDQLPQWTRTVACWKSSPIRFTCLCGGRPCAHVWEPNVAWRL